MKRIAGPAPKARARDVFVYFDNDVKVRAPYDAMLLAHRLGLGPKPAASPDVKADVRPLLAAARQRWPGYGRRALRRAFALACLAPQSHASKITRQGVSPCWRFREC